MAIFNVGSINIDHVYQVEHFVQPGETLSSNGYQQLLGGKGANQSIALAQAGADAFHVGKLSKSDADYKQALIRFGVDCKHLECTDEPSGHAIIQVTPFGENAIVLFGGANQTISPDDISQALASAKPSDWVLTQNETSCVEQVLTTCKAKQLKIAFNPAPMTSAIKDLPLDCLSLLIVNEVEAQELSGQSDLDKMEQYFRSKWPELEVIITMGKVGVRMLRHQQTLNVSAFNVEAVDTTAAGDTFIGYFLAAYSQHSDAEQALKRACAASALAVTKQGAAQSIPAKSDVERFLANHN
jgi:ribokinase